MANTTEMLLELIKEYPTPVDTSSLWTELGGIPILSRKDLYNTLVKLEGRKLIKRGSGKEINGHTICFNWIAR